jgi:hypothetical protein
MNLLSILLASCGMGLFIHSGKAQCAGARERPVTLAAMKRDPALVRLSHDHHQALVVAQQLRRATAQTSYEARAAFLAFWEGHGRAHFWLEEEVLLPAYAAHGDSHHPVVAQVLCDHVAIRQRADALSRDRASTEADLNELGAKLAEYVRLEERQLFTLIETTMPHASLAAVADAFEQAERATHESGQAASQTNPPTIAP